MSTDLTDVRHKYERKIKKFRKKYFSKKKFLGVFFDGVESKLPTLESKYKRKAGKWLRKYANKICDLFEESTGVEIPIDARNVFIEYLLTSELAELVGDQIETMVDAIESLWKED